jgi:putative transposase
VWADNITYIRTDEGFLYLNLIMDLWSRKIVGYHTDDTLETEGTLRALSMALSRSTIQSAVTSIALIGMLRSFRRILLK